MQRIVLTLCVVVAAALVPGVASKYVHGNFTFSNYASVIDSFGFARNGTVQFGHVEAIAPSSLDALLYLCTDEQWQKYRESARYLMSSRNLCRSSNPITCELQRRPLNDSLLHSYAVRHTAKYLLVLVDCSRSAAFHVQLEYLLLNPHRAQLSLGQAPLPLFFVALSAVWLQLIVTWLALCWRHCRTASPLHALLLAGFAGRLLYAGACAFYWLQGDRTGQLDVRWHHSADTLRAVADGLVLSLLIFLSKGWRVTRRRLPPSDVRIAVITPVIVAATLAYIAFLVMSYYYLVLMVVYFFLMPLFLSSISVNFRVLRLQLAYNSGPDEYEDSLANQWVRRKLLIMHGTRLVIVWQLLLAVVLAGSRALINWRYEWACDVVVECGVLLALGTLGWLARPDGSRALTEDMLEGDESYIFSEGEFDDAPLLTRSELNDLRAAIIVRYPCAKKQSRSRDLAHAGPLAIAIPENSKLLTPQQEPPPEPPLYLA